MHIFHPRYLLLLLITLFLGMIGFAQGLVINEVLSRNSNGVEDEDGDSSDWVELYNASTQPIDLDGFGLSDDLSDPLKWVLPSRIIAAGDYIVVFASGKDRSSIPLHSNFRIAGEGETLLLSSFDGGLLDEVIVPALEVDEAYARRAVIGAEQWVITPIPTPGASNIGNQLYFSHDEGFYEEDFELSVQSAFGDTIYFTRDGSIPSTTDEILSTSISITSRSGDPNIISEIETTPLLDDPVHQKWVSPKVELHKGNVLRFVTYSNGNRSSLVYTKTYFSDGLIQDRYTVPVVSLVCDSNSLFGHDLGIYIPGANFDQSNPVWSGNYTKRGRDWERDAHVAYFDQNGQSVINQDLGIRIHGGKTRNAAQKSFRLYARSEYGKSSFEYRFFEGRDHAEYSRLVLRASAGSWGRPTIINDALAQRIVKGLDFESQETQPVIVYLNGEYWGLYTMVDRIDERYIGYERGLAADSVFIWDWNQHEYDDIVTYAVENDMAVDADYQKVANEIDVSSFIDYNIAEQFFANIDWPANNSSHWRKLYDGKWRWIFFDLDAGFSDVNINMFERMMQELRPDRGNEPDVNASALYRNLLANENFKNRFIDRYTELLRTTFSADSILLKLKNIEDVYRPEIQLHAERWNYPERESQWSKAVSQRIRAFLDARPCIVRDQLVDFFKLDSIDFTCISNLDIENLIGIAPNPNSGAFSISNESDNAISFLGIEVFDAVGQSIYSNCGGVLASEGQFSVQLDNVSCGLYFLKIDTRYGVVGKRILINRY